MVKNKPWSVEELNFIRNNPRLSYSELSERLGRSVDAIKQRIYKLKLRPTAKWSKEEESWLRENLNLPYSELSKKLGRSVRAIKHKLGALGLRRNERRRWTDNELRVLKDNPNLTPKELSKILNRSEFQIAKRLREVRGTANRRFKRNWDVPSCDLAYFIGMLCSDGGVYKYKFELSQSPERKDFINKIAKIIEEVFGMKHFVFESEINGKKYVFLESYSVEWLKNFGTEEDIKAGRLKHDGEWIKFVNEKFSWVFKNEFFWYFVGGLFDGDGSLLRKNYSQNKDVFYEVRIAVRPEKSKRFLVKKFRDVGLDFVCSKDEMTLRGGKEKVDFFLKKVQCVLAKKKRKDVIVGTEMRVGPISYKEAKCFLKGHHYLRSCPVGVRTYGFFIGEDLCGVAAFGVPPAGLSLFGGETTKRVVELRRFALIKNCKKNAATVFLSRVLRLLLKDNPDLYCVITYSDEFYDHFGTIYRAYGAQFVGYTKESVKFELKDGSIVDGRYAEKKALEVGIKRALCGGRKRVFVMVLRKGGLRKKILNAIDEWKKKRC